MKANDTDWKEVTLGSILRYLDERVTLDADKEYLTITVKRRHGGLEIREKLSGHQIATKKQFRLVPGAFIISRVQCWHQAYALVGDVPPNAIASTNYDQFRISPEVDPRFFWWLSHSPAFTDTVRSSAVGVVIEKMVFNRDEWLTKSVRLPPLVEQRRVVARIEELSAQLHEARTLRQQAGEEAEILFRAASRSLLDRTAVRPVRFGDAIVSCTNGLSRRPTGSEDGPIVVRLSDVGQGELDLSAPRRGSVSGKELEKYSLLSGDLLFVRVNGSRKIVGRCVPVRATPETICYNDHLIRVRVDPKVLDWRYACLAANVPQSRAYIEETAITTAGQLTVNQEMLKGLTFPIPPLLEQCRIVAELDALQAEVDALKRLQAETSTELDALLPSILDRAFAGGLI